MSKELLERVAQHFVPISANKSVLLYNLEWLSDVNKDATTSEAYRRGALMRIRRYAPKLLDALASYWDVDVLIAFNNIVHRLVCRDDILEALEAITPQLLDKKLPNTKPDMVVHPPHYTAHPSGIECIKIVEHMPYNIGTAMKYLWRCNKKHPDPIEDLNKSKQYIDFEIARLTRDSK